MDRDKEAASLKRAIVKDLKTRGTYNKTDDHIINTYVGLVLKVGELDKAVAEEGYIVVDKNDIGRINPKSRLANQLLQTQATYMKLLGISPYGRKLTTGFYNPKKAPNTKAGMLTPFTRKKIAN